MSEDAPSRLGRVSQMGGLIRRCWGVAFPVALGCSVGSDRPVLARPTGRKVRPFSDTRTMVEAIAYRYRTGITCRDLPAVFRP